MKHEWEQIGGRIHKLGDFRFKTVRRCVLCGALQTRESLSEWMRVVGYTWYPLVGKCKGKKVRRGREQKS
jgi:hypothetical protein